MKRQVKGSLVKNAIRSASFVGLAVSLTLAACDNTQVSTDSAPSKTQTQMTTASMYPSSPSTSHSDDPRIFEVNGDRIVNSQIGDLNGDGLLDALVVLDRPKPDPASHDSPPRIVVVALADSAGRLRKAAQNDKIVPCAECGGIAGDPFGYSRIEKDGFTLLTEGGSRERWWNEFTFTYAPDAKTWVLAKVRRGVNDTVTEEGNEIALTSKDFGYVKFQDFDPTTLPEAHLP